MFNFIRPKKDLAAQLNSRPVLRSNHCVAEQDGAHAIKITRQGRLQGVWRKSVVSYDWYPPGHFQPAYRATTIDDAVDFVIKKCASQHAA